MRTKFLAFGLMLFVAACGSKTPPESEPLRLTFTCEVPLPDFTLGEYSNPTDAQLTELCDCIWKGMAPWAKEAAKTMRETEEITGPYPADELNMRAFANEFTRGLYGCGGDKL